MTGYGTDQWAFAPRAVRDAPNFALNSLLLWHGVGSVMRPFTAIVTPPEGKGGDFKFSNEYNLNPDIMHSVILSGPSATMWGNVSGIS